MYVQNVNTPETAVLNSKGKGCRAKGGTTAKPKPKPMNEHILTTKKLPDLAAMTVISALIVIAVNPTQAQTADPLTTDPTDQSQFPQIIAQPVDQCVTLGSSVVLSVQANNADGYQWLINGVPADGQTNNTFAIPGAAISDVGLYSCQVFNGPEMVPTRSANVCVYTVGSSATVARPVLMTSANLSASAQVMAAYTPGGGPITVYGTPVASNGSQSGCPGHYIGYVTYSKPPSQGWGWAPIPGMAHTATDTNRPDTKIQYYGAYGDTGCNQTSVSIPNPAPSPVYQFTIYFTNNVPTNAYPMVLLSGFNP